jgi:3'(2'), 5'-bisphosphate nucleotidase
MLRTIDLDRIEAIARAAGAAIMEVYARDFAVDYKDDESPLTEADLRANTIICEALARHYPDIPILSEENQAVPYEIRKDWTYFWLVDPIDGTKEFIKRNDEFTVNIALICDGVPVLGVVYAPALGELYAAKQGEGAYKNGQKLPLYSNPNPKKRLTVVASKSHLSDETQAYIDSLETEKIQQVSRGSSLKLCMVAEGSADLYPRLGPTMEWDTAAADAVVRESGKMCYRLEGDSQLATTPLSYNKSQLLNPWFLVR